MNNWFNLYGIFIEMESYANDEHDDTKISKKQTLKEKTIPMYFNQLQKYIGTESFFYGKKVIKEIRMIIVKFKNF